MQEYTCKPRTFVGIDTLKETISKMPSSLRQELNLRIDIDFVSNSDRIEGINDIHQIVDFLNDPNIKVLRSAGSFGFERPQDDEEFVIPTDEPHPGYLPKEYLDYLRNTNLLVFNTATGEEHYIETTGHFAAITEMANEARRARRACMNGVNIPLDAEFIADHLNAHVLGTDYGRYRSEYYFPIVGLKGCDWCIPGGDKVDDEIATLLDWYNNKSEGLHPIVRAAILHAEFVRIHPFADGNGRTARLLSNYELVKNGYPTITIKAKNRAAYVLALNKAIMDGDITDLVDLFTNRMIATEKYYAEKLLEHDLLKNESEIEL